MAISDLKLKLIHKGLILVSVPLSFGFVFVLIFQTYLQDVRHQRTQSVYGMKVSQSMHKLVADVLAERQLIAAHDQQLVRADEQTTSDLQSVADLVNKSREHEDQLRSNQVQSFAEIESAMTEVSRIQQAFKNSMAQQTGADAALDGAVFKVVSRLNEVGDSALTGDWLDSESTKGFELFMHRLLAAALGINVILCPLIVLIFSQNFVSRLSVIIANNDRFAKGQPLLPPVQGSDEISKLDAVFRQMVDTVRATEATKKEFVEMISHDLRTPLNSVQATLTLLGEGIYGKITADGLERIRVAERASSDLINLVNDLLDMDKLESGNVQLQLQPAELQSIIERALDTVSGFAQYKEVRINASETEARVLCDSDRIVQVVVNLLSNAIKFAPEGSNVEITVRDTADQIEVRISDHGRGVPAELKAQIFERFRQVDRADSAELGGKGLGLAICKAIITEHKGTIGVDSDNGGGSTFWFRLRKCEQAAPAVTQG